MNMSTINHIAICSTLILSPLAITACKTSAETQTGEKTAMTNPSKTQQVVALLKSIETGAREPASVVSTDKYIQHNLAVADGLAGFGAFLASLPKGSARVNTVRAFEDGDFVFTHTEYNLFGPKIGFDVFRFEDGKIVEHWDNLQVKPNNANPSQHTMIDGPTTATDLDKTAQNKQRVQQFVEDILVNGKMNLLSEYFDGDNYIQHNPNIGDGVSGLGKALKAMAEQGITMKYTKVHRVLGQGNFVLTISEGTFADKPTAFYDLFRVENNKIAEHWDVIETIPPKSEWKNQNGKF